jgi:hypothetical protein
MLKRIQAIHVIAGTLFLAAATGSAFAAVTAGQDANSIQSIVDSARSSASADQVQALSDGLVTLEEVNSAVARTADCAIARGVKIELRPGSAVVPASLGFAAPTLDQAEAARVVLEECKSAHLNAVQQVFAAQNRPTAAQAAEGRVLLGACMTERGIAVPPVVTEADLIAWARSADKRVNGANADCVERHYRELGFWP